MAEVETALGTSASTDRYYRILRLLVKAGTKILRDLFDYFHKPSKLSIALNIHKATLKRLLTKKRLSRVEWSKLYPTNSTYGESSDFDLTLLFKLLRNICNLTAPKTGWDNLPNDTDICLEADIARVKYHRNSTFAHNDEMGISEDEFDDFWEQITGALLRIFGHHNQLNVVRKLEKEINRSRTSAITERERKCFLSELFPAIVIKCVSRATTGVRWIIEEMWKEYIENNPGILMNEIQGAIFPTAGIIVDEIRPGSVIVQIRVRDLDDLMDFWERYQTGELRNDHENVLINEEMRKFANQVKFEINVSEDEYLSAQQHLEELEAHKRNVSSEAETYEEMTETIETMDGDELSLVHGPIITDRESKFQAHFVEVTSKKEVDEILSHITKRERYAEASNIIWAYRVLEAEKGDYIHASDDGGKYLAGTRLEHLLNEINAVNVVVIVTCWDGDVYLGLDKFRNINECTLNLLMAKKMVPRMASEEVVLFLEKMEDYFEARKHKAAHAAYAALSQEAHPSTSAEFEIIHSETITVPKSSFQAHLARVTSQDQVDKVLAQLKQDRKIQKARFNMFAYRIFDEEKKTYLEGESDDGENRGGKRLLHLLQIMDVENAVVIVTRWKEGDVHLGPERFKYINACAIEVTKMATEFGWIEARPRTSGAQQKKTKKGKRKMSTKI